ncbi:MAG TPA: TetR/AcrR family transcriptional regulator [Baekduia sp.]|uniref:TetR/AcrR family transcriptional regulator n=1 Tax=Baekduia sp. TaxID=2600305 RepID=UPI002D783E7E|nr:TetR/AcrR family transcriptional regulator [Baekduia sp.]HET6507949.1 TetR/AcrR family transcriptional regulator [Baekduia sp.]
MSRDREILDAAAALFYEKGFHGVGVDQIGERVGISGPALYRHFSGKDEILATLLNETLDELITAAAPMYDDPRADLERLIRHHVEFSIEHRHLVNVYQREVRSLVDPWRRQYTRRMQQYASRWEDAITRSFPDASSERIAVATQAAIGLIHSVTFWPPQVLKTDNLADIVTRLVDEGLATLGRPVDADADAAEAVPVATRSRRR